MKKKKKLNNKVSLMSWRTCDKSKIEVSCPIKLV